ncbi:natterin-3-like [Lolium rigidum]|uniref:natterin-3-like n=1 Tax=Lolium rigidum TaxID=89674 RepID=UPI001F5DFFA9|nr:natterin-3-like [Lolium rigidum]
MRAHTNSVSRLGYSLLSHQPPLHPAGQGNMGEQLPRRVVFKGDNGNYMAAVTPPGEDYVFLQFYADKTNPRCIHTIYPHICGTVRIKSDYYGKFWRRSPNWIWVDCNDQSSDHPDTVFRPVKLDGEGMYALQNLGNSYYCKRLTCDYKQSCLNADSPYIVNEARLKMEEAVLSRRIYDVCYRTEDAKIQGKKLNTLITQDAVNRGSRDDKEIMSLNCNVSRQTKWDSSASIKLGVSTKIEAGIPGVASESIEVSGEVSYSQNWGQTVIRTEGYSTTYEVTVPPNTMVTVRMVATEATCEVPFSYIQEDVLYNGEKVVYKFDDGIYRGVNSYGFKVDHTEQKL